MKKFNQVIGMCAVAAVFAGCRTTNSITGEQEYTAFGRVANTAVGGTTGFFKGMVNGATSGWKEQEGTNDVSFVERVWNATKSSTVGMVTGAAESGKDGFDLTVQESDRRKAEDTAARNAMWMKKREEEKMTK